jgi:hypothetical protein
VAVNVSGSALAGAGRARAPAVAATARAAQRVVLIDFLPGPRVRAHPLHSRIRDEPEKASPNALSAGENG